MSDGVARLAAAEVEAARARARLSATLTRLQDRLEPRRLADEARRSIADMGAIAAGQARDAVIRRPGALAGVAAATGLFLVRHRIAALIRRGAATAPDDAS